MKKIKIALAGNPNAGKTTLFNLVARTNYHVGNYPGVTVEKKKAIIKYKEQEIEVVDLPGTYSLNAYSLEEIIARDYIVNEKPDLVVQVVDASNLERNLYLTTQLLELETNLIISLNMFDVASKRGIEIDVQKLSEKLEVPIVKMIARSGMGKLELLDEVINFKLNPMKSKIKINYGSDLTSFISEIEQTLSGVNFLNNKYPLRWLALKYLENDKKVLEEGTNFAFHEDILKKIKKL